MKNLFAVSLVTLLAAPSIALAAGATPTPKATATPAPVPTAAPIVAAPEPTTAPEPEAPAKAVSRFEPGMGEPNEKSVGVGAGWFFPSDIFTPNTVSVRFRLKSGTTIEPIVNASFNQAFVHQHAAVSGGGATAERNYNANLAFAVQFRKPMKRKGPVELHCLVTPGVTYNDSVDNGPGIEDRFYQTTTTWALGWGLGVEYFPPKFEQHWSFSMDATNPLFAFVYDTQYDQASRIRQNTTGYALGATFNPAVRGMAHLYF